MLEPPDVRESEAHATRPLCSSINSSVAATATTTSNGWRPPPFSLPLIVSPMQWVKRMITEILESIHDANAWKMDDFHVVLEI